MRIALIQLNPVFLNLNLSIKKAITLLTDAKNNSCNLVVFPETWFPGYPVWLDYAPKTALWDYKPAKNIFNCLYENSLQLDTEEFCLLQSKIKELELVVILGINEKLKNTLYNTMVFFNKDGSYKIHRKLVPTYTERLVWGRGDGSTLNTIDTEYGKIGGLVCWEHWMPLARAAMHSLNETIHIAQWPFVKDLHQTASKHYAFEGQCFVISSGSILKKSDVIEGIKSHGTKYNLALDLINEIDCEDSDFLLKGGSCIIKPDGEFLLEPDYKNEIIYSEIDLSILNDNKMLIDTDGHYSRPDVFSLTVNTNEQKNVSFDG